MGDNIWVLFLDSCDVQDEFETLITHCRNHYNWIDDDTVDYLPGWKLPEEGTQAC